MRSFPAVGVGGRFGVVAELGLVLKIFVLQRDRQLGADKLALACYGDGLAQGVRQTFQTGSSAGVEQVAVHGLRQGQLALDAVQAGCQNQPDDQIRVCLLYTSRCV